MQSARDAYPGSAPQSVTAESLVCALLDEFPFEQHERSQVTSRVRQDFSLPGRRDLLYLVLCTLAKNAMQAMRGVPDARLMIEIDVEPDGLKRPWMRFVDNGPGIPLEMLEKLTREPVTTKAQSGGTGMGLMFCQRVMQSMGGAIEIDSAPGEGTAVTLYFRPNS